MRLKLRCDSFEKIIGAGIRLAHSQGLYHLCCLLNLIKLGTVNNSSDFIRWRKTVYGFVDANIPGPEPWFLVGNILQAIPIKAAGLFTFNEWAKRWPFMFK